MSTSFPQKAIGPDGLPSDLFHRYPVACARLLYAQLLKLLLHGQESIVRKGGRLATAYKHKGPHNQCDSYRSLLVSSHAGKVLHKTLRMTECSKYEKYMQKQQYGGRRGVPVQLALHTTRAYLRTQKAKGRSVGILFLDLKEAFYRVVRGLVTGQHTDAELFQTLASRLHLSDEAQHNLREALQQEHALSQAGLSEHAQRAILALHCDTHFHLPGQHDCCRTAVGTRPGDSWADVIFGFAWARLLAHLETTLHAKGILDTYEELEPWRPFDTTPAAGEQPIIFIGATWMDDLSLCISGANSSEAESRMALAAGILLDSCYDFGTTPNLSRGKTEALLCLQGRGSRKAKARLFTHNPIGTMHILGEHQTYELNVVGDYVHLGNQIHHSGQDGREMRRRLSIAHQAFNQHRRAIYANPQISKAKKLELFESLIISKLMYGAETWTPSTRAQQDHFHSGVMRLYRRLAQLRHDAHIQDDCLLASLGSLSPSELLRRQRLRYLCALYKCSEAVPWALYSSRTNNDVH